METVLIMDLNTNNGVYLIWYSIIELCVVTFSSVAQSILIDRWQWLPEAIRIFDFFGKSISKNECRR